MMDLERRRRGRINAQIMKICVALGLVLVGSGFLALVVWANFVFWTFFFGAVGV